MKTTVASTFGRALRRAALPLGCYYAVTLVLPLANGAAHANSAFAAHALAVLVLPPCLIGLVCTIRVGVTLAGWNRAARRDGPQAVESTPHRQSSRHPQPSLSRSI
jgi:hypothetical protein